MARKRRICIPNATYHIYSRCIETRTMMEGNNQKDVLIDVLNKALDKYHFELIYYQIMDNHFHLVIKTLEKGESISRIAQFIKARFAEKYNRLHKRTGPFWNERFKHTIIDESENPPAYLLFLLWHLAFNPVRKGKARNPYHYKHGSINYYLSTDYIPGARLKHHEFYLRLGNTFQERVRAFLAFKDSYLERRCVMNC